MDYIDLIHDIFRGADLVEQILSSNHILAAVFRAANDLENGRLKSRNVHSEIVFALSPNNNVSVWMLCVLLQHSSGRPYLKLCL